MRWDPPELEWLPVEAQELVRFACTRMVHSYKPVLMLAIIDQLPATEFPASTIADAFERFYLARETQGLPVERRGCRFVVNGGVDGMICRRTSEATLKDVFETLRHCLELRKGIVTLSELDGWRVLKQNEHVRVVAKLLEAAIGTFYDRVELLGEAVYGKQQHRNAEADQVVFLLPDPHHGDGLCLLWPEDR